MKVVEVSHRLLCPYTRWSGSWFCLRWLRKFGPTPLGFLLSTSLSSCNLGDITVCAERFLFPAVLVKGVSENEFGAAFRLELVRIEWISPCSIDERS